jgi:MHS family proline/betaine transporter-like MFS transporter
MNEVVSSAAMCQRVIWSSTIGNALEWFDFAIFGAFAAIIGQQFFPKTNPTASLLSVYGLFGIAYIARPLGGIVFGVWADRVGRKRALVTIVLTMAFGTAVIGLLPTYEQIGLAAPALLLAARLIQGFSAGGEFGTSTAMLVEFAPPGRRGFFASFQFVAQAIAFSVAAAFAFALNSFLSPEALHSWGWRVPFPLGIIIGPVGFYLRLAVDETPEFKAYLQRHAGVTNTPLRDVLSNHTRALFSLLFIIAGLTATTYSATVFAPNFAATVLGLKMADVQIGLFFANLVAAIGLPAAAALSDRIGRRRTMIPAIILYLVLLQILMRQLLAAPSNPAMWSSQALVLVIIFISGPACVLALEAFPVGVRSTGASIVYNFAVAIFGGLAPLVSGWLIEVTGDKMAPIYYVSACMLLTLIGLMMLAPRVKELAEPALSGDLPTVRA